MPVFASNSFSAAIGAKSTLWAHHRNLAIGTWCDDIAKIAAWRHSQWVEVRNEIFHCGARATFYSLGAAVNNGQCRRKNKEREGCGGSRPRLQTTCHQIYLATRAHTANGERKETERWSCVSSGALVSVDCDGAGAGENGYVAIRTHLADFLGQSFLFWWRERRALDHYSECAHTNRPWDLLKRARATSKTAPITPHLPGWIIAHFCPR